MNVKHVSIFTLLLAASCGYDWDGLEPDGTDAWGGAGGAAAATGGTGGRSTGGTGGSTAGTGGSTAGSGGGAVACTEPGAETGPNDHCYFALAENNAQWSTQRTRCEEHGAHLATITSAAEQQTVEGLLGTQSRWIGLSKSGGGSFVWISNEALDYENWRAGEPNDSGDTCVRMRPDGSWTDRSCNDDLGAICERE